MLALEDLATHAHRSILDKGGITVNLQGHEPTSGYAYSPYPELERVLPASMVTPETVLQYLNDTSAALAMPDNYLGAWHDQQSGNVFLDVSHVGPASPDTIAEAAKQKQLAVFDLANFNEIPTGVERSRDVTSAKHAGLTHIPSTRGKRVGIPANDVPFLFTTDQVYVGDPGCEHYDIASGLGLDTSDYGIEGGSIPHEPYRPGIVDIFNGTAYAYPRMHKEQPESLGHVLPLLSQHFDRPITEHNEDWEDTFAPEIVADVSGHISAWDWEVQPPEFEFPDKFHTSMEDMQAAIRSGYQIEPHLIEPPEPPEWHWSKVDPDWLQEWIQANGPFMKHSTRSEVLPLIHKHGLLPWDAPGVGSKYKEELIPRADHVYLKHPSGPIHGNAAVYVDLRKLDPNRINADEDPWWNSTSEPYRIEPHLVRPARVDDEYKKYSHIEDIHGRRWLNYGHWADDMKFNEPHHVAHSLNDFGTIAVKGGVNPEAFVTPEEVHQWLGEHKMLRPHTFADEMVVRSVNRVPYTKPFTPTVPPFKSAEDRANEQAANDYRNVTFGEPMDDRFEPRWRDKLPMFEHALSYTREGSSRHNSTIREAAPYQVQRHDIPAPWIDPDLDPESIEQPFIVDHQTRTVHLGPPGTFHSQLADSAGVRFDGTKGDYANAGIIENGVVNFFGNNHHIWHGSVTNALSQHQPVTLGKPYNVKDEWENVFARTAADYDHWYRWQVQKTHQASGHPDDVALANIDAVDGPVWEQALWHAQMNANDRGLTENDEGFWAQVWAEAKGEVDAQRMARFTPDDAEQVFNVPQRPKGFGFYGKSEEPQPDSTEVNTPDQTANRPRPTNPSGARVRGEQDDSLYIHDDLPYPTPVDEFMHSLGLDRWEDEGGSYSHTRRSNTRDSGGHQRVTHVGVKASGADALSDWSWLGDLPLGPSPITVTRTSAGDSEWHYTTEPVPVSAQGSSRPSFKEFLTSASIRETREFAPDPQNVFSTNAGVPTVSYSEGPDEYIDKFGPHSGDFNPDRPFIYDLDRNHITVGPEGGYHGSMDDGKRMLPGLIYGRWLEEDKHHELYNANDKSIHQAVSAALGTKLPELRWDQTFSSSTIQPLPVLDYPASMPGNTRAFLIGPNEIHLGAPGSTHDDLHDAAGNDAYDMDAGWITKDGEVGFFQGMGDLENRIIHSLKVHTGENLRPFGETWDQTFSSTNPRFRSPKEASLTGPLFDSAALASSWDPIDRWDDSVERIDRNGYSNRSPEWLAAHIAEHGPYLYHHTTSPESLAAINERGLIPHDQGPGSQFAGNLMPRANAVYMAHGDLIPHDAQHVVAIDLRKLDPNNLIADEDTVMMNPWAMSDLGLPEKTHPSWGQYADEHLNDPSHAQYSLERGTLAHRGPIPPEAIVPDNRYANRSPKEASLTGPDAEARNYEPLGDEYWGAGGCGRLAVAMRELHPELKIGTSWDRRDGTLNHAWVHDGQRAYDSFGVHEHAESPHWNFQNADLNMDTDPQKVADHFGFDYHPDEPWADDQVYEAAEFAQKHFRSPNGTRTAGETRTRMLQRAQQLPQDTSEVVHQFPDGWSVRRLKTYGDMHREGELMSNCFSATPATGGNPHPAWEHSPIQHDYPTPEEIHAAAQAPLGGGYQNGLFSLRDPHNLPHVSLDEFDVLGRHNSEPKPEYFQRIKQWAQAPDSEYRKAYGNRSPNGNPRVAIQIPQVVDRSGATAMIDEEGPHNTGDHPFIYYPESNELHLGPMNGWHADLMEYSYEPTIMGRVHPETRTHLLHDPNPIYDEAVGQALGTKPYKEEWQNAFEASRSPNGTERIAADTGVKVLQGTLGEGLSDMHGMERRPVIYSPGRNALHIGPAGSTHKHVAKEFGLGKFFGPTRDGMGEIGPEGLTWYSDYGKTLTPELHEQIAQAAGVPLTPERSWNNVFAKTARSVPVIRTRDGMKYYGDPDGLHAETAAKHNLPIQDLHDSSFGLVDEHGKEHWLTHGLDTLHRMQQESDLWQNHLLNEFDDWDSVFSKVGNEEEEEERPSIQNPDKFFTSETQHERRKKNWLEWIWKRSAADPEWIRDWISKNGPYMYHGTTQEGAKKIAEEGLFPHDHLGTGEEAWVCFSCKHKQPPEEGNPPLCPSCHNDYMKVAPAYSNSTYAGSYWEPRAGHVYLGTKRYSQQYATNKPNGAMVRVDLRKLDPAFMNADEDHWHPNNPNLDFNHPIVKRIHDEEPPPSDYNHEPGDETLGQWADNLRLGQNEDETHYSMGMGSLAYNSPVPADAIERVSPYNHQPYEYDAEGRPFVNISKASPRVIEHELPDRAWKSDYAEKYRGRRPLIYDPVKNILHIGSPGGIHADLAGHAESRKATYNVHYGWIGHNPEKVRGDWIEGEGKNEYGWMGKHPGPHVDEAMQQFRPGDDEGETWEQMFFAKTAAKLWVDDERRPDTSWEWARNAAQARKMLSENEYEHVSLDHDLGTYLLPNGGQAFDPQAEDGTDLAQWMVENKRIPKSISIHSWNPEGAERMRQTLDPHSHVTVEPYGNVMTVVNQEQHQHPLVNVPKKAPISEDDMDEWDAWTSNAPYGNLPQDITNDVTVVNGGHEIRNTYHHPETHSEPWRPGQYGKAIFRTTPKGHEFHIWGVDEEGGWPHHQLVSEKFRPMLDTVGVSAGFEIDPDGNALPLYDTGYNHLLPHPFKLEEPDWESRFASDGWKLITMPGPPQGHRTSRPFIANEPDKTIYVGAPGWYHGTVYDNMPNGWGNHWRGLIDAATGEYSNSDMTHFPPEVHSLLQDHGLKNGDEEEGWEGMFGPYQSKESAKWDDASGRWVPTDEEKAQIDPEIVPPHWPPTDGAYQESRKNTDFRKRIPLAFDGTRVYMGNPGDLHSDIYENHDLVDEGTGWGIYLPEGGFIHEPGTVIWPVGGPKPEWEEAIRKKLNAKPQDEGWDQVFAKQAAEWDDKDFKVPVPLDPPEFMPNKFLTDEDEHEKSKKLWPLPVQFRQAAAHPAWLNQWIAQNGPYMVHETTPPAYHKIVREGLLPHDTISSGSIYRGHLVPRSGHVYLRHPSRGGMHLGHMDNTPHVVVDLRKLNPQNVTADEDAFMNTDHQEQFGMPIARDAPVRGPDGGWVMEPNSHAYLYNVVELMPPDFEGTWEPRAWKNWGEYADNNAINEPEHTAHSFNYMHTMAHKGGIHPSAFVPMEVAHETLRNWTPPGGVKGDLWSNPTIDYTDSGGYAGVGNPDSWPTEWAHAAKVPFQSAKVSKETFPQKQRKWDELLTHYPDRSKLLHTTPEGYTINHLKTYGDVSRTGLMLHNCWRGHASMSDQSTELNPWNKIQRHSLNDENGHPQIAFILIPGPNGPVVSDPLGRNNRRPKPEHEQALRNWAQRNMYDYQEANYENPMLYESNIKIAMPPPDYEDEYYPVIEMHNGRILVGNDFETHAGMITRLGLHPDTVKRMGFRALYDSDRQYPGREPWTNWYPTEAERAAEKAKRDAEDAKFNEMWDDEDQWANMFTLDEWEKKQAKETKGQEMRRWEALHDIHPNTARIDHNLSNGWTVQQLLTRHDVNRVGKFMKNCWQGKSVLMPKRKDDCSGFWTLNDERGLPRAAFMNNVYSPQWESDLPDYPILKHNELDKDNPTKYPALEIDQALGMRNERLNPDHAEMFREWAASKGLPIHVKWGGGATHFDHPTIQNAMFSGKGHIFDGGTPIRGIIGEGVPAGSHIAPVQFEDLPDYSPYGERYEAKTANWEDDFTGKNPHPFNYDVPVWKPGKKGKGLVSPEGRAYTWETTQEHDGRPSHGEVLWRLGQGDGSEDELSSAAMQNNWSFYSIESDGEFRHLFGPSEHKAIMKAHLPQEPRCADCGEPVHPDQEGEYQCPHCKFWGTYYGDLPEQGWEQTFAKASNQNWVEIPHDKDNAFEEMQERPLVYDRLNGTVYVGAPGNAHGAIFSHIYGPDRWYNDTDKNRYKALAVNHTTGELNEFNDRLTPKEQQYVYGMIHQHLGVEPREPGGWEQTFSKVREHAVAS